MGLDITHDCWHGAYSAFFRWRNAIAEAAGYYVWKVEGSCGPTETVMIDWGHLQDRLMGDWPETPSDPLLVLLAHSDCEGRIAVAQLEPLANRLEELLPKLSGDYSGHIGLIKEKTEKFIAGLRSAATANEDVEFH